MPKAERLSGPDDNQNKFAETRLMGPWVGPFQKAVESPKPPTAPKAETELAKKLKEKKEPSLGERNALLFSPELMNPEAMEAIELIIRRKVEEHGGLQPSQMRVVLIPDPFGQLHPRFIVRFNTNELPNDKVELLEKVTREKYEGKEVKTRKTPNDKPVPPSKYPQVDIPEDSTNEIKEERYLGWTMGVFTSSSPLDTGLLIHKDVGDQGLVGFFKDKPVDDWFYKDDLVNPMTGEKLKGEYNIELREAGMYQTDLVEYVTQVATILGKGEAAPHGSLFYDIYNDLNRLGIKDDGVAVYGLDEQVNRIYRSMILPLANLDLSSGISLNTGSALTIGVPGTGKTAVARQILQADTGVFFVPVDPKDLAKDIHEPPARQRILPRIEKVFNTTQIPVVLFLDDLENISLYREINASLLAMMAGVRDRGFFILGSTNYPERLDAQFLQPQRFGEVIYFGLHNEEARRGILNEHVTAVSKELTKPLFESDEQRDVVLDGLAHYTEGFTPRYLAEICREAKALYLERITKLRGQNKGLSEVNMGEEKFTLDDWSKAFDLVSRKYDKKATVDRDRELQEFVKRYDRSALGFRAESQDKPKDIFNRSVNPSGAN